MTLSTYKQMTYALREQLVMVSDTLFIYSRHATAFIQDGCCLALLIVLSVHEVEFVAGFSGRSYKVNS